MSTSGASRRGRGASAAARLCVAGLVLVLAACTSSSSLHTARRARDAPVHVVQRGETLYQIAWQHRVDQRELTVWNGLADPNELRVGQRLRLVPPRGFIMSPEVPAKTETPPVPVRRGATAVTPRRAAPPPRPSTSRAPPRPTALAWGWPTEGRVVSSFGARRGIDSGIGIRGRQGQPVRAAAAGRVVYAGGGLIGYGQLVIIKHDETFLSAYGYNSDLLVTQGQEVARGATIALMGQGPEREARLHFEIRRNGVPVDPLLVVAVPR